MPCHLSKTFLAKLIFHKIDKALRMNTIYRKFSKSKSTPFIYYKIRSVVNLFNLAQLLNKEAIDEEQNQNKPF
jgi:hypothetical protein